MSRKPGAKPHGQIRRSQIITTFGPGSMVDLPNHSVLIAGLDHWSKGGEEIVEPRLVEKLQRLLELPALKLYSPPPHEDNPTALPTGITAWQFPEWFITQDVEAVEGRPSVRSRMLVHRKALTRGRFVDRDKKKRNVVPVRFVRACRAGHIADIDWYSFVHSKNPTCRRQLWMDDLGTSGDLAQIFIRCECGEQRPLSEAAGFRTSALGLCGGGRPWLGPYAGEKCNEPSRLLIRTASNAYFPQLMSVISLPDRDETVKQAVDKVWEFLEGVEDLGQLRYERRKARVNAALEGLSDEEVFAEIQSRLDLAESSPKTVKQAELETLVASKPELGEDKPDGTFFARALPRQEWDVPWMEAVERVVLIHRLREVVAQVGFTRFEAAAPDLQGELEMGVSRADLAREPTWLPAVENRGEGFFLQFRGQAIAEWLERDAVIQRGYGDTTMASLIVRRFAERFRTEQWPADRPLPDVYYDPRSLDVDLERRACLHAKCVVVDRQHVFVSSANFTEAAQERNIEVGLLVWSRRLAEQLTNHFDALLDAGSLVEVFRA